jgi:hypothetical protein
MGEFDVILDSLKPKSGGKRRRRGGATTRRGSVSAETLKTGLVAGGVNADAAAKIADIIASAQNIQLENQTAETIDKTRAVVKAATELTDSSRALLESKLKEAVDTLTYVYANVKSAAPGLATGAVVGVGAVGYASWQSKYVREAMLMMMPMIIDDVQKYVKETLSMSTLFSIALFIFTILFVNSITRNSKPPKPPTVEKDALTLFEADIPTEEPTTKELDNALKELDMKVAAAEAAQALGNTPVWTGANAVPLAIKNGSTGGRRRSTSRRLRRAAYLPRRTRRSSSGRRRGYSRRQRG